MAAPPIPGPEPGSPGTHSHNAAGIWPARPPPPPPWRCAGPGPAGTRARPFLFLSHRVWRGRSRRTALAPSLPAPAASGSLIRCRGRGESLPRLGRPLAPPASPVVSAGLSDRRGPVLLGLRSASFSPAGTSVRPLAEHCAPAGATLPASGSPSQGTRLCPTCSTLRFPVSPAGNTQLIPGLPALLHGMQPRSSQPALHSHQAQNFQALHTQHCPASPRG